MRYQNTRTSKRNTMYKDRFEIEKEQRLQDRVMGGCAVAIIVFLMLIIACSGCSSRKAVTATETVNVADSVQVETVAAVEKRERSWGWLQTLCDSINARLTADSVVTPTGAVIHRPVLDLAAVRPQTIGMSASSASEDAASASQLTATRAAQSQRDTSEESDNAAVYKPPETSVISWICAAVALFLLPYLILKLHRKWKQRHLSQ